MKTAGLLALLLVAVPLVDARADPVPAAVPAGQPATEGRIAGLRDALHIETAEMPQWTVFAQAMRDNASATGTVFRDRAARLAGMNAADNMASYAAVTRAYADSTRTLSDAFAVLYGSLSAEQKRIADALFRHAADQQVAGH